MTSEITTIYLQTVLLVLCSVVEIERLLLETEPDPHTYVCGEDFAC